MSLPTPAQISAWADQAAAKTGLGDLSDFVSGLIGGQAVATLTIAAGSVTASSGTRPLPQVTIDTEGAASTDTLDTIDVTEFDDGQFILVGLENAAHVVTLSDSAGSDGQMVMADGLDLVVYKTTQWVLFYVDKSGATETLRERARFGFGNPLSHDVTDKTANYTVLDRDDGSIFTNDGAGGAVAFTLPTPRAGLRLTVFVQDAQNVQVVPAAAEAIWSGTTSSTTGWQSATAGAHLELLGIDASTWKVVGSSGTWTSV